MPGWEWGRGLPLTGTLCTPCGTVRTKVCAVLELWVQVCGASAKCCRAPRGSLSHLLRDISPPADALRVKRPPSTPSPHPIQPPDHSAFLLAECMICSLHTGCAAPGSPDGFADWEAQCPKKLKLDRGGKAAIRQPPKRHQ